MSESILEFQKVEKSYITDDVTVPVLTDFNLQVSVHESVALVGPSGSGKSTILALSAGLEEFTAGEILLLGTALGTVSEERRTAIRRKSIGFIFQTFELIPSLNALENVMVPAELLGNKNARKDAEALLVEMGLAHRHDHLPSQLSGGERQRIAIARAFINAPQLLLADEPTGNLDKRNSEQIANLLFRLNQHHGTTLIVATHDLSLAARCARQIAL